MNYQFGFRHVLSRALATTALTMAVALYVIIDAPLAYAVGADIGDFVPTAVGQDLMALYLIKSESSKVYKSDKIINKRASLDAQTTIFRAGHTVSLGADMIAIPQFFITYQSLSAAHAGLNDTSGSSDPAVGMPFWPYINRAAREYVMVAPYIYLPLGEYDRHHNLNTGENRWKAALQLAYQRGLTDRVDLEISAETNMYGANDDYGLYKGRRQQRPWYEIRGGMNYQFSDGAGSKIGLGGYLDYGGETKVDGVLQGDEIKTRGVYLEVSTMVSSHDQFLIAAYRDLEVESGFKMQHQLRVRFLHFF